MFTSKVYKRSPIFLQNTLLSLRAYARKKLRENKDSDKLCDELIAMEHNAQKLEQYSREQLSKALDNATNNVKHYRDLSLKEKDLKNFPYLTKDELRQNAKDFESSTKPKVIVKGSTSGTTGTPLSILQSMDSVVREQAFVSRALKWAGYEKGDKRAWIRGDIIVPVEQAKPPFWRYSWFEDMIILSSFHLAKENLSLYIKAMVDFNVDIIQAYPSSITTLARYLESEDLYYPGEIKSVFTSSEYLSPEDRQVIETRFKCKVFDWYGQFERVAAIASCEHGRYHILTDYSQVELLADGENRAEIVGTNFNNHFFPIIKYKTGDHVILSDETSCPCGRHFPIVKSIEGRVVDYVFATNGNKVFALDQCVKGVKGVLGSQYIQHKASEIQVNLITDQHFDTAQETKLTQNIQVRLGTDMQVNINLVSQLERTKNGKVRQAICHVEN